MKTELIDLNLKEIISISGGMSARVFGYNVGAFCANAVDFVEGVWKGLTN